MTSCFYFCVLFISELDPTVQVIQNDCFPSKYDGQGCVQKCKMIVKVFLSWIPVPNDERQQEQRSRAKHSRVTWTFERSPVFDPQRENTYLRTCSIIRTRAMYLFTDAHSEDSDQTARMRSLIWYFTVHLNKPRMFVYLKSTQRKLLTDCADEQCWSESSMGRTCRRLHFFSILCLILISKSSNIAYDQREMRSPT